MKNSLILGFLLGMIFPILAFLLMKYTDLQMQLFADKPTGLYVIAAGVNLVSCWLCYKREWDKTANGLVIATFLSMLFLIFTKNIALSF